MLLPNLRKVIWTLLHPFTLNVTSTSTTISYFELLTNIGVMKEIDIPLHIINVSCIYCIGNVWSIDSVV